MARGTTCSSQLTPKMAFDNIQRALRKLGTERNFFNMIKNIYEKPTANMLNGERMKVFPLLSRTKMPTFTTAVQYCTASPAAAAAKSTVVSDSVRPHRRQPTRLLHPWDSPGKNTGVGCHFLLQCVKGKRESDTTLSDPWTAAY